MGGILLHSRPGGGRTSDIWDVLRHSGKISPDVWVRDVGGNTLHH